MEKPLPAQPGGPPTACPPARTWLLDTTLFTHVVFLGQEELCPASSVADLPFFPPFPPVRNLPHHTALGGVSAPSTPAPRLLDINSYPSLTYCQSRHWGG